MFVTRDWKSFLRDFMKGEAVKGERKHNGVVARPSTCAISFIRTFNKATSYPITRSCENTFLCVDLPHFHPISIDIIGKNVKSALLRTFSKPNVIVGASNFALSRVEFEKESVGRGRAFDRSFPLFPRGHAIDSSPIS